MKYFYYDINDDDEIEGNAPLEKILQFFYELSEEAGSFFGLINEDEQIIQLSWENETDWLIDIPQMGKDGSLQKIANYDECVELIKYFYEGKSVLDIEGLEFSLYK